MKTLIYFHGFNSSANSRKATITRSWLANADFQVQCLVPQLPDEPTNVVETIERFISDLPETTQMLGFMGSSMGGFFANYFAERYELQAVLINPAVYPHRLLKSYLGKQRNPYTGNEYELTESMVSPLQDMVVTSMRNPASRMVLAQKGDEVLDYRETENFYRDAQLHIEEGGDHSFQDYERWLPRIAEFFKF